MMGLGVGGAGKYVPPSRKGGFGRSEGEPSAVVGEDHTKIRVTNISEDTTEGDLRDLFSAFGRINRCTPVDWCCPLTLCRDWRRASCDGRSRAPLDIP